MSAYQRFSVGVFLDTSLLEAIKLLACLPIEVITVDDKEALLDIRVVLEECQRLERGQRLMFRSRVLSTT